MRKIDLIRQLAKEEKISERKATSLVYAIFDILGSALAQGEKIKVSGFGTFLVVKRKGRKIRNPRTHKITKINDYVIPHFRAGEPLKQKVREVAAEKKKNEK